MGRKKKKSGGVSANHAESDESRETPAEEGTGEAPEAIEYDTSKLILDEFHESVEELPSHGKQCLISLIRHVFVSLVSQH